MSRQRKPDPTIPKHIDQKALPKGVYWDRSGNGRWYVKERDDTGRIVQKTIAHADATLAHLHTLVEQMASPNSGTLDGVLRLFHQSKLFRELAERTREDYDRSRGIVSRHPTKLGVKFGTLKVDRLTSPMLQRLIDQIAEATPTTAKHVLQYLKRVIKWAVNRGHCKTNPVRDVEAPEIKPRRRLPSHETHARLLAFARERGARLAHREGSVPAYLSVCMEIAYLCHLRGIELCDLREDQATEGYLIASRRKGSRTTHFRWTPRLRAAWAAALELRDKAWERDRRPVPIHAKDRPVIVAQNGDRLTRGALDNAWQRLVLLAIEEKAIEASERFGIHDLKRKGISDRQGTRAEKQDASGHRDASMMDVYDFSVPLVDPAQNG